MFGCLQLEDLSDEGGSSKVDGADVEDPVDDGKVNHFTPPHTKVELFKHLVTPESPTLAMEVDEEDEDEEEDEVIEISEDDDDDEEDGEKDEDEDEEADEGLLFEGK